VRAEVADGHETAARLVTDSRGEAAALSTTGKVAVGALVVVVVVTAIVLLLVRLDPT
jgi:hypothetical protein